MQQMPSVVLAVFQCWYPHTFKMQPIALLQKTAGKTTSTISTSPLQKTTGCNKDWLKNLFFHFLPPLHNGSDFSSGYLTLDIFNDNTFFDAIQKTDGKWLYINLC